MVDYNPSGQPNLQLPPDSPYPQPNPIFENTTIAVRSTGFTELGTGGDEPKGDIVIIHGLQGHPWRTWACQKIDNTGPHGDTKYQRAKRKLMRKVSSKINSNNVEERAPAEPGPSKWSVYWPLDMLPKDFPDQRILTYGYDSHVSHFFHGATNQGNIFTIGRTFLNDLAAQRLTNPSRPLLFICHSLGGLVVKEALKRARGSSGQGDEDLFSVFESTFAILFFGTPHRGSAFSSIGLKAVKTAKLAGFSVNESNVRDLKENSPILEELRESFASILDDKRIYVTTFQESDGYARCMLLDGKVVDIESSGLDHPLERKFTINANHMDICRFNGSQDDGYEKLRSELIRHLGRLKSIEVLKLKKCHESLYIPDMYLRAEQIDSASEGTLTWLLRPGEAGPGLSTWLSRGKDVFWIQGKPGSGKSTAMKYIFATDQTEGMLDQPGQSGDWKITSLFFTDRGGEVQRSWKSMLHAMLYELLSHYPDLRPVVVPFGLHENSPGAQQPPHHSADLFRFEWNVQNLQRALLQCKSQKKLSFKICFLIDALDEHEGDPQRMGEFLKILGDQSREGLETAIKICVASRPSPQMKDLFGMSPGFKIQEWTRPDIDAYVRTRMSGNYRMHQLLQSQLQADRAQKLLKKIMRRADGVFLWVRLVLDQLCKGLEAGDSIGALEHHLDELPDDLNEFFEHMLKKVDPRYCRESFVILELVLRARVPLTVLQIAMLLYTNVPSSVENCGLTGENPLIDLERQIRTYTGGLLELKPPYHPRRGALDMEYESDDSDNADDPDNEELIPRDDFVSVALSESAGSIGQWTVQPLHQTVKEFLRQPGTLNLLFVAESHGNVTKKPDENGHVFMLKACRYWLGGMRELRDALQVTTMKAVILDVLYHSPLAEQMSKAAPTEILVDINSKLSAQCLPERECWPFSGRGSMKICFSVGEDDRFTFMAFAIASNMHKYVGNQLHEKEGTLSHFTRRSGLPLLFFALMCPGHGADASKRPSMVRRLLGFSCDPRDTIPGALHGTTMDALATYFCGTKGHDWDVITEPFMSITSMLLKHGSNPNGTLYMDSSNHDKSRTLYRDMVKLKGSYGKEYLPQSRGKYKYRWITLLHGVSTLPIDYERMLTLFHDFVAVGADINAKNSDGKTLLQALFEIPVYLPLEGWLWLLEHGAKIMRSTVESDTMVDAQLPTHGLYSTQYQGHPLRHQACRKAHFYHWRAQEIARNYNSDWKGGGLAATPTRFIRRLSDTATTAARELWERKADDFWAGSHPEYVEDA